MKEFIVMIAEGFEEVEAITQVDYLRRAEILVHTVSISDEKEVTGAHGVTIATDKLLNEVNLDEVAGIIIPGGLPGATNLRDDEKVIEALKTVAAKGGLVAAICAGPIVLEKAGLLKGKKGTCYPGVEDQLTSFGEKSSLLVVRDGNVITSRGPSTAVYFALEIIEAIKGAEKRKEIEEEILIPLVEIEICK